MNDIYVLISTDSFLLEEEKNKLIKSMNVDSFNISSYSFSDTNPLEILSELTTISLLGEEKVVIVSSPEILKPSYKNADILEKYINYFENPSEDTTLIILSDFELDEKLEINKVLVSNATVKKIEAITGETLDTWVKNKAKANGYVIDDLAVGELIDRCGGDTSLINNELEKLMIYQDDKKITRESVMLLVSKTLEDNIYNLINAFFANDNRKLLSIYDDLMTLGEDEMLIISSISKKLEEIVYTKVLLKQGLNKDQIAGYFKVKPGRAYYMIETARKVNDKSLNNLITRITDLDFAIKSGSIDKKLGLHLFILGA